ncbi:hypothetical protein TrLO_g1397 [Triparma laevis f. longispina]|uniref:EGF-like domain-containing protein n=1 Tax=Triparma laevis f. longispina TaxID=1714387 RepID=A0A9W7A7K5_9STRA|nr:hypothetical protein TrLO_g1397 [Triparma laevis f. longispina]
MKGSLCLSMCMLFSAASVSGLSNDMLPVGQLSNDMSPDPPPTNPVTWLTYLNADNMNKGTVKSGQQLSSKLKDADSCAAKCASMLGSDPTTGCTSYTYYHADYHVGKLQGKCFGDSTGLWSPIYSNLESPGVYGGVTSGQNDPKNYVSACKTIDDCSANGVCNADTNTCECYPQWMGKYCGQLNLVPTDKIAGLQSTDENGRVSSWGGSVLLDEKTNKYHMFAAEMTHNTGIVVWMSNSRIRHAVSDDGVNFMSSDVTSPVWGHEPTAARAPTGEYVVFFTANFETIPCSGVECKNSDNGNTVIDGENCLPDTQCNEIPDLLTYMIYSKDPAGPWSEPVLVPTGDFGTIDTNLAPIILEDGSLIGLGRPPWIWRATAWNDTSTYVVEELDDTVMGEDPFLYVDPHDSSILHGLSHAGGWDSRGGHAWSLDGGKTWKVHEDIAAYGSLIEYTDGTSGVLTRRERPHLVLDKKGNPLALTNGATLDPCTHPEACDKDYCFTALQKLNQE